ncbi:hypothetical protein DEGR_20050 [Deinococcus grandis]|nr:hypothetical protein DEGR_20050 [Deinococcus grandis]
MFLLQEVRAVEAAVAADDDQGVHVVGAQVPGAAGAAFGGAPGVAAGREQDGAAALEGVGDVARPEGDEVAAVQAGEAGLPGGGGGAGGAGGWVPGGWSGVVRAARVVWPGGWWGGWRGGSVMLGLAVSGGGDGTVEAFPGGRAAPPGGA